MPNWWKKQLPDNEPQKSRYTFSIEGDYFSEEEIGIAEKNLTGSLGNLGGVRVNSCDIQPFEKVF
jgi:hypothetical protein